jgi:thiamine-monophosphate kinase
LPNPRLNVAAALTCYATAAMDISDGLIGDCEKLLMASKVSGRIEAQKIPHIGLLEEAITGGDDYELLATFKRENFGKAQQEFLMCGVTLTPIGQVETGEGLRVLDLQGDVMLFKHKAYQHF